MQNVSRWAVLDERAGKASTSCGLTGPTIHIAIHDLGADANDSFRLDAESESSEPAQMISMFSVTSLGNDHHIPSDFSPIPNPSAVTFQYNEKTDYEAVRNSKFHAQLIGRKFHQDNLPFGLYPYMLIHADATHHVATVNVVFAGEYDQAGNICTGYPSPEHHHCKTIRDLVGVD